MVKLAWPKATAHLSSRLESIKGGMSADDIVYPGRGPWMEASDGFDDRGGVGYARKGGVPAGVGPRDCVAVASATVGDWRGDDAGRSSLRELTSSGGNSGVVAYRSRSTSSGSISMALALPTSMAMGVGASSSRCSLLVKAGVEVGDAYSSCRSIVETWWMEPASDDDRVEGTLEGVALRDTLLRVELRSRTLRDNEGKRLSSLPAMLCADASNDRRRLARRSSESQVVKYSS
jgi:hypothetical protein